MEEHSEEQDGRTGGARGGGAMSCDSGVTGRSDLSPPPTTLRQLEQSCKLRLGRTASNTATFLLHASLLLGSTVSVYSPLTILRVTTPMSFAECSCIYRRHALLPDFSLQDLGMLPPSPFPLSTPIPICVKFHIHTYYGIHWSTHYAGISMTASATGLLMCAFELSMVTRYAGFYL
jgi:hypothetical protein